MNTKREREREREIGRAMRKLICSCCCFIIAKIGYIYWADWCKNNINKTGLTHALPCVT